MTFTHARHRWSKIDNWQLYFLDLLIGTLCRVILSGYQVRTFDPIRDTVG